MVNVELQAAAELADTGSVEAFCTAYEAYGVLDLWLNVPDHEAPAVVTHGLLALREDTLACGVPLGMFVMGDLIEAGLEAGGPRKLILCKVSHARISDGGTRGVPLTPCCVGCLPPSFCCAGSVRSFSPHNRRLSPCMPRSPATGRIPQPMRDNRRTRGGPGISG